MTTQSLKLVMLLQSPTTLIMRTVGLEDVIWFKANGLDASPNPKEPRTF